MNLALLWARLKIYVILIGVALASIAGAYFYGKHEQRLETKSEQAQERVKTITKAREIENNVQDLPESDLDHRLDKWMRD